MKASGAMVPASWWEREKNMEVQPLLFLRCEVGELEVRGKDASSVGKAVTLCLKLGVEDCF